MKLSDKSKEKQSKSTSNDLLDNWEIKELKQIAMVNPETICKEYSFDSIKYLDVASVEQGSIVNEVELSIDKRPSRAQRIVKDNDILISTVRPNLKHYAYIKKAAVNQIASTGFAVIRAEKINPRFLYYYLIRQEYTDYLSVIAAAHTSTYPSFNPDILEDTEVVFPIKVEEQKRIAKTLSDLDDKIELNNKMNQTLEKIAQAIFKHWFIDFEFPVKLSSLKAEVKDGGKLDLSSLESILKSPGYRSAGGKMVDSEMGKIPEGWKVGKIGDLVEQQIGGDWGKDNTFINSTECICLRGIDLADFKTKGFANRAPVRWIRNNSVIKRTLDNCDILIAASGLGPIGKSIYCGGINDSYDVPVIYSNFCKRFRAKSAYKALFAERVIHETYVAGGMNKYHMGTSIPNLDSNSLLLQKTILPSDNCIQIYGEFLLLKHKQLYSNQNDTLSKLRDYLLPRLILGKLKT